MDKQKPWVMAAVDPAKPRWPLWLVSAAAVLAAAVLGFLYQQERSIGAKLRQQSAGLQSQVQALEQQLRAAPPAAGSSLQGEAKQEVQGAAEALKGSSAEITTNLDLGTAIEGFERLRKSADDAMADTKPQKKAELRPVFLMALRLREMGKEPAALHYLMGGLERNPWALARQLDAAEMLQRAGKQAEAESRIQFVLEHAESDADFGRALLLQGKPRNVRLPPLAKLTGEGHAVVLIPAGPVDTLLLDEVRGDLAKLLAIPIMVREAGVKLPPPWYNDSMSDFADHLREEMFRGLDPLEFQSSLDDLALTANDLRDLPTARRFISLLSERLLDWSTAKRMSFWARSNQNRWATEAMLLALSETVKPLANAHAGYLAVTRKDLYDEEHNHISEAAKRQFAVMSYHRFRADFNGEEPYRARLRKRVRNQCISSIGMLFEIPRCQDLSCPRCYVSSLAEQGRQGSELCPLCRKRFTEAFGVEGKPLDEQASPSGADLF